MGIVSSIWRMFLMVWLAFLVFAGHPARAAESYITAPGEAARAAGLVGEKLGRTPEVHTLRITDKDVTMLVHGTGTGNVEEWRVRQGTRLLFFSAEVVGGPSPRQAPAMVDDLASGLFALDAVALAKTDAIAKSAIAYAKLEGEASVQSIEIARRVYLLPSPSYGDIRWSIYVASPRESATVYADADGTIIGGDLSNTARARNMNFINDDDWPKEAAIESLTGVIGGKPIIRDLTVYPKSVQVKADHPTTKGATVGYSWDISGVTRSPIASPMFPGTEQEPALSLADIDLSKLGTVRDAAKKAWGNDKSTLNYMMLRLFSDGPGKPEQRWTVHFTDWTQSGELALFTNSGTVDLTADGIVRVTDLPDARQPKRNWLDATTTRDVFAAVGEQFGKNARFAELSVSNDAMRILAEVPDTPGKMREYNANDRGITASSMMMPWDAEFHPERLFRMDDLAFFSAEKLNELTARTFTRLKVGSDMSLSRYTFSIGQLLSPDGSFMVPSPDGKVTLEIRLEGQDGWKGGRVTYSSTGEEIDVVMP
ncbi:hypothetical protein MUO32_12370 [Shinella sp. CPCC 101442]|uniref:hypothetical protein n=1 Tax=Shinella sp. CPCC 101442 TaxID=2932265 RepID=UPI0021530DC8|nr:hypothetical protein [Shinella sp. CPCC 101442]MCR6499834.1 hypothetical protein [Shinella sp. CPCC 101442]